MFGTFHDHALQDQIVIPTRTMAEEFFAQPYSPKKFKGQKFLEGFRDDVLPDLTWSDHQMPGTSASWKGKARRITHLGLDEETTAALHTEIVSPPEGGVDFVTGHAFRRHDRAQRNADDSARYEAQLAETALNPTQRKILDYLKGLNYGHLLLRKVNDNHEAVRAAISTLSPHIQDMQWRIYRAIQENPQPYYLPSKAERTCRLSPRGDSILGLKKEVRRAATIGWVECDLRSSQFAILSARLNAPISKAFLARGESIWREFNRFVLGSDQAPRDDVKGVFKEAVYALCYGEGEKKLAAMLESHGITALLEHPIMKELLTLRNEWFREIDKAGGAADVWGTWHAVDNRHHPKTRKSIRGAHAVGATIIQSIEMEIIAPIFDVASKYGASDQFSIAIFQHDGATVSFQSKGEKRTRAERRLKEAVEARAKQLGVTTTLEFTPL